MRVLELRIRSDPLILSVIIIRDAPFSEELECLQKNLTFVALTWPLSKIWEKIDLLNIRVK